MNKTTQLFFALILGLIPSCDFLQSRKISVPDNNNNNAEEIPIGVFGQRFFWIFQYPGKDNKLGSCSYKFISEMNPIGLDTSDALSKDDFIVNSELHLPVKTPILLCIRSRDVIHSLFLPQFRVQMNAVPGMTTHFRFKPELTTDEMRILMNKEDFNYLLYCNRICGESHFEMKKQVVIETKAKFNQWIAFQLKK